MNEIDFYCKYVVIPLKKEYEAYQLKLSKKWIITKKDKRLLEDYQRKMKEVNKKLEELIDDNYKMYQKLVEYGILSA